MARNPNWCRSLDDWKDLFTAWIREPNPEELLRFNIFFDRRALYADERSDVARLEASACGASRLAAELQRHVHSLLDRAPSFFFHLAVNTLKYRPPIDIFGRIKTDDPTGRSGTVDLKDTLLPIVNFARLYALRDRLDETNTRDRLLALTGAGAVPAGAPSRGNTIDAEMAYGLIEAYDTIQRLRLRHQAELPLTPEEPPDNRIAPADLDESEHAALRTALAAIEASRRRIETDFPGAGTT